MEKEVGKLANKWADYLISKVKYDAKHNYITDLYIHKDAGDKVGSGEVYSRQAVISAILKGTTFNTIYKENNKWTNGAKVEVVKIDGINYLRTDTNDVKKDNLGELPEF